jgi:hypothetical protein
VRGLRIRHGGMVTATTQDHVEATRAAFAEFLRDQSEWRRARAREWPEDPRNARSADALVALAGWVMALPEADPRLQQLAAHQPDDAPVFLVGSDAAALLAGRYGFTFPADPDRFLGLFASLLLQRPDE